MVEGGVLRKLSEQKGKAAGKKGGEGKKINHLSQKEK